MALTVLNVAYPLAPVGPDEVGGAEQVLTMLDRALVEAGHRSLVIAPEGSSCAGELLPTPRLRDTFGPDELPRAQERHREAIRRALERHRVDVVHLHGVDFDRYVPDSGPPVLATLHLPPAWYRPEAFARRGRVLLNCVSRSQQRACPPGAVADVLPNGVPVGSFDWREKKEGYVLALGRICPEKGFHLALAAARRAGLPLVLAGRVFPYEAHERYFAEVLAPLLDDARLFVGPAGFARKRRLLAAARCLVVPSQAPETSSLVAMEALASGTPVVAWKVGALPEIVDHGKTGFLVESAAELEDALRRVDELDPRACRQAAEERFDASLMARRYLATYENLAGRHASAPRVQVEEVRTEEAAQALEPAWEGLFRRSLQATAFSHPGWLLAWWRAFRPADPRVLAIRRGDRLLGLVPLLGWEEDGARVLGLFGGGVSDVQDALVDPEEADAVAAAFAGWLRDNAWDRLDLDQLRPDSPLLSMRFDGLASQLEPFGASPILPLSAADEAFERRRVPYYRRRLAREDGRFEAASEDTREEFVEALFRLHEARWSLRGEPGVLADPRLAGFHRDAISRLFPSGIALLRGIRLGGRLVAVSYTLADRGALRFYVSGFDPAVAKLEPGTLLIADAIDEARRRGLSTFDFLRGREPYKYAWGASDLAHVRRVIRPGGHS